MTIKLGVVMDPISAIDTHKDTTLVLLLAAQEKGWSIHYMEQSDLFIENGEACAHIKSLEVFDNEKDWYRFGENTKQSLSSLDIIIMRKDPPVDLQYIYTTHILELAQRAGTRVVNNPQALRDFNEKLFITWFPEHIPQTLVTSKIELLKEFIKKHNDVVVKPLHAMGGFEIFHVQHGNDNVNVILETLTKQGRANVMAQLFIPQITQGDKRIILVNGDPITEALARLPKKGDFRGNLAAGGSSKGITITDHDRKICRALKPVLQQHGLAFVGIDVIGEYLTEINITSPTCIRQINQHFQINIGNQFIDHLASLV